MPFGFSILRASLGGQWVPSCSSISGMQLLHSIAASCCSGVTQQLRCVTTTAASSAQSKPTKQQKTQQQAGAPAPAQAADQQEQQQQDAALLQQLQQQYQRSRLLDFYHNHLSREMMLKLNVYNTHQLPRLKSIDLSVSAKDLHGKRYVEKWEMLLPALALEYITGQPAQFVHSSVKYYKSRNAVTGVKVHLTKGAAMDLLQKLVYIVLPSQNGFAGITSRSFDKSGNLHFRVQRMVNFPDFEEQFELFEELGALHVSINLTGVSQAPLRSQLLLSGLQLPILNKIKGAAAEAEAEGQEAEGSGSETEGSESDDE